MDFNTLSKPLNFQEAIDYFKDKLPIPTSQYYRIANEWKTRAFTVGGYSSAELLNKFMEALESALEEGSTLETFRKQMSSFLETKGYEGLTPFQADNIFRTNIQTAYNVGHYKQMADPEVVQYRPYWQYDAINDSRTRPTHRALDGKVFPANHPFWDTWYPPNGYKCRCRVKSLTQRYVDKKGLKIETEIPMMVEPENGIARPLIPDRGFDKNPAKVAWEPDTSKFPKALQKAYENRQSQGKRGE